MIPLILLDPHPVERIKAISTDPIPNIKIIVNEQIETANSFYTKICNYVPHVVFITTLILLCVIKNIQLILFYLSGFLINVIINRLLRNMIKDTRLIENGHEKYNMPSGHSQITLYSTAFIVTIIALNTDLFNYNTQHFLNRFVNKFVNYIIILFYLLLSFITTYKCVDGKYHTLDQVIVGVLIGCIIGTGTGYFSIKTNLCKK